MTIPMSVSGRFVGKFVEDFTAGLWVWADGYCTAGSGQRQMQEPRSRGAVAASAMFRPCAWM